MNRKALAAKFQDDVYDITVTGRHMLVTDAMKDYAIDKIVKIDRFNARIIDVNIVMDIQKLEHRVDITLKVDHVFIKASATAEIMYASIDKAIDKIETQLRRYKDRINEHQKKGGDVFNMNVNILENPTNDVLKELNDDIESESLVRQIDGYRPHKILTTETRPLKTLNEHEAVMKMELSGDFFMIFRGEEDQKLKVIYRRNDGNFAIIEPEK
ncbi:MAG: ribosome-associated translation inhibitor RaiA [Parachlamydiaceae bacterium]|nr:ribosome-associated translation inhibitor RaiA [Parachlamydiaceae bacterium]